jgi:hypothetical protein
MISLRGKSVNAVARDIAEGYVIVNPIFLKPLDVESIKGLYEQLMKVQMEIRGEKFPFKDVNAIRSRNMRLQRLHTSIMIIKNFVKERRIRKFFV